MNIAIFLSGLRARYRVFLILLSTTVLSALVLSLLMSKTYVASTSLLTDLKNEQTLNPDVQYFNERERASYLQTQIDILTSPRVARRVVQSLRLHERPVLIEAFGKSKAAGGFDDWMARQLLGNLTIDTSQSSIIKIAYAADDPVQAAVYANAFAKAYIDSVLEMRVEPLKQASAWFDEQGKVLRANLDAAQARLTDFQRQTGIYAADERYDQEIVRLSELTNQAARSREPASVDRYIEAAVRDNRSIDSLKNHLATAKARLLELSGEFGDRHPRVIRQTAEVAALTEQLDSEMKAVTAKAERGMQAARQQSHSLQSDVAAQRQRVGNLRDARAKLAILRNEFANAQRTYDLAMQRSMASSVDSRAMMPNVSVLSEAAPPASPVRPKTALNLMLAGVIGSLLGLAAVFFLETSDRRLRVIDDLAGDPVTPLLAVLNGKDPARFRLLAGADTMPTYQHALPWPR